MLTTDRLARAATMLAALWHPQPRDVRKLAALAFELADTIPEATLLHIISVRGRT